MRRQARGAGALHDLQQQRHGADVEPRRPDRVARHARAGITTGRATRWPAATGWRRPEGTLVVMLEAESAEGETEGQSRRWWVNYSLSGVESTTLTPLGEGVQELREEGRRFLDGAWLADLHGKRTRTSRSGSRARQVELAIAGRRSAGADGQRPERKEREAADRIPCGRVRSAESR